MDQPDSRLFILWLAIFSLPGLLVCARMLRRVRERGGRVTTAPLGLPDLLMSFFLAGFFGLVAVVGGQTSDAQARVMTTAEIVPNLIFFTLLISLLVGFLLLRRISPIQLFGLERLSLGRALLIGALIVAAIFPLIGTVGWIMTQFLAENAQEQDVVKLYRQVADAGDHTNLAMLIFVAVLFQPAVEEIIFRGYFYPTFKGWAGPVASAVCTATLFATIHLSVAALPALLVLALALTLAYEWSGSLLVPVSMHAVFNGVQLTLLTWGPELEEWCRSLSVP
jgi:membrane protease YdiL (CAAX protease family)